MVQSLYLCGNCKKQFRVKDSESYKILFYIFLWLSVFVAIFVITIPLLVITVPIAYYFYGRSKKLKGKKFYCPFCKKEMQRTGIEEKDTVDLVGEPV
ncbi:MAG: hypothetical protein GTN38_03865 [Candidatus Aenigmarchaeota archaeon]|nr:hypothetical protein [Candidatus Aenigmarchaeota archaeon]NIP40799.1 hypothetical protein [Candidatus Aenigmarchaeota archaeon]NIQ17913.1 hypothetical protein [Candidatus Aenigmarchaeota archaeon]NIS73502.1 hypothetical protein [Candidatus Aenigmarchaeota archaeon]